MIEILGGMMGGLGLFFVGVWLLTENLKALAGRRLRMIAHRRTGNRMAAFSWSWQRRAVNRIRAAATGVR